jgi:hypothetical protein
MICLSISTYAKDGINRCKIHSRPREPGQCTGIRITAMVFFRKVVALAADSKCKLERS